MVCFERHIALTALLFVCAGPHASLQAPVIVTDSGVSRKLTPEEFIALGGNADEYEDDIILPKKRNGAYRWGSKWSNGVIPYVIDGSLNANARGQLQRVFDYYHQRTCIKFVPRTNQRAYVLMKRPADQGCNSQVGKVGRQQIMNLPDWCINEFGSVVHEMMHAIGFYHEQARPDRDSYVTVYWDRIDPNYHSAFEKKSSSKTYGTTYDYGSLMHYSATAFSKDGRSQTLVPKNGVSPSAIGQRNGLSQTDIYKINAMYQCSGKTTGGTGTGGTSNCVDKHSNCGAWAARGECQNNPAYMRPNCQKSCLLCPGSSCADTSSSCGAWAARGECQNNPAYMLSNCKKSCGTC